ncbi:MAG: tetratricopeptide repeat protein, partial [Clostridium sp.]
MNTFFKKIILLFFAMLLITTIGLQITNRNTNLRNDSLEANLELINNECNKVFSDIDGSEIKYLKLLETEKNPFKIGLYSSALVQIYTYKQDYDKIVSYGEDAIANYKKVDGGAYYAISEKKYLAWSMYNMGEYLDSFILADNLLDLLNSDGNNILTPEKFAETEALIYSIFLRIYTRFDILDQAELYYNKLSNIKGLEGSNQYIIEYSKLEYAIKINDVDLRKQFASKYYEIILELDKKSGNNVADSAILALGTANIYVGEYTQALDQIQRAEKIYIDINDSNSLALSYYSYAQYYRAIGDSNLALDYYNKSIDLY